MPGPGQSTTMAALPQQRGSRCHQGVGERKRFCNWLKKKKPHHKTPRQQRERSLRPAKPRRQERRCRSSTHSPRPARAQRALGMEGHREAEPQPAGDALPGKQWDIRQRRTHPLGEWGNTHQKRPKHEKRRHSLAAAGGRPGKERGEPSPLLCASSERSSHTTAASPKTCVLLG